MADLFWVSRNRRALITGNEKFQKLFNNPRYRTELCMKYHYLGSCPYGDRCSYIHEQTPKIDLEKCLEELEQSSLAESPSKLEKSESSMTCAEGLVILRTETENTNK